MTVIPHSRPSITAADIAAVDRQLASGMVAEGNCVEKLETRFASAMGKSHAVATGSGSQALLLALRAAGVAHSDEVIVPNYVCGEVLGVIQYLSARPVIVDVDENYLLSLDATREALTNKTKAIVLPYTLGIFCDPRPYAELGPVLIEDCAQFVDPAPHKVSAILGQLAIYSFEGSKVMAAGEGGMIVTDDLETAGKLRRLKQIGTSEFKLNLFPLSDLQASLALSQLDRLPELLQRRIEIAEFYFSALASLPKIMLPKQLRGKSQFFRFPIRLAEDGDKTMGRVISDFAKKNVIVRRPVTPMLDALLEPEQPTPIADQLYSDTLSIPLYPALSDQEMDRIVEATRDILS